MRHFSEGEQVQAAPLVRQARGGSLADIADRIGVRPRTLRSWMSEPYNLLQSEGLRGRWSTYSPEFERRARYIADRLQKIPSLRVVAEEVARLSDTEIESLLSSATETNTSINESAAQYAARARGSFNLLKADRDAGLNDPWDTYPVVEGIELRVRRPVSSRLRSRLRELISQSRQALRET